MTYIKHDKDLYSVLAKETGEWKFMKSGWKPSKDDVDHNAKVVIKTDDK